MTEQNLKKRNPKKFGKDIIIMIIVTGWSDRPYGLGHSLHISLYSLSSSRSLFPKIEIAHPVLSLKVSLPDGVRPWNITSCILDIPSQSQRIRFFLRPFRITDSSS